MMVALPLAFGLSMGGMMTLQYIWGVMNPTQLLTMFPLFSVAFPANALSFYVMMNKVSNFNIIPLASMVNGMLAFAEEN